MGLRPADLALAAALLVLVAILAVGALTLSTTTPYRFTHPPYGCSLET